MRVFEAVGFSVFLVLVVGLENRPIQIVQIIPKNENQLFELIRLYETGNLDFWRAPTGINETIDVMVDKKQKNELKIYLKKINIEMKIIVEDLEKIIEEKEGNENFKNKAINMLKNGKRDISDVPDERKNNFGLPMGEYYSYDDIVTWMKRIQHRLPGQTKVVSIGKTVENRDIWGIKVGNPVGNFSKRIVWIDGGIHAREWTAVHTSVYLIYSFANGLLQNDPKLLKILEEVELVIFPILNPDGYEYTRSDPRNALVRMWRKNRSQERCATDRRGQKRCCRGVDLNRNFDYRFAETGTSFHPCSEIFHGAGPFSEPETRAVRDAISSSDLTGRIEAYITLHAYSQLWIYPFSNRKQNYPADVAQLKKIAKKAVSAIGRLFGTRYRYGTGPEIIYAYTGGSSDWAKDTAKIKYSYTIELRPSYFSWNGFVLEKSQLIPTARETLDGIFVVLDTVAQESQDRRQGIVRSPPEVPQNFVSSRRPQIVTQTSTTTVKSGICEDTVKECSMWLEKKPNLCATARSTMRRQCGLTCGLC